MSLTGENRQDPERASIDVIVGDKPQFALHPNVTPPEYVALHIEITRLTRQRDALRTAAQAVLAEQKRQVTHMSFTGLTVEYDALRAAIEEAKP